MRTLCLSAVAVGLMAGSSEAQQAPNPAASYCVQQGGSYEIVQDASGARGMCVLPDGRRVDAWAFFREAAAGDADPPGLVNPAAAFCVEGGGAYRIVTDATGARRGHCVLPDGSEVDAWEHFRNSR